MCSATAGLSRSKSLQISIAMLNKDVSSMYVDPSLQKSRVLSSVRTAFGLSVCVMKSAAIHISFALIRSGVCISLHALSLICDPCQE